MDAPVRYVHSRDGTRIAYNVTGEGPALLYLQVPSVSHIELYPRLPGAREYLERLGRGRKLIRMDFRGTGMSEREFEDHSPEALTDDVEAVLDDLGIDHLDVDASGARVTPALGLAIRRPSAVSRMILGYPFTVRPPGHGEPGGSAWVGIMESNWELFLETTTQRNTGHRISEVPEVMSLVRRCMDQRNYVAEVKASRPGVDWERAAAINIPVLVVEFTHNVLLPSGLMQSFAEQFSHGRFMALPEGAIAPPYGPAELLLQAIEEFLGPPPAPAPHRNVGDKSLLTAREREVLTLLTVGKTQPEIAIALVISPSTVSRHVVSIYAKIGAHRRAEAVSWAIRNGFG